jgi:NMD protein affecting ribosome stability and mRNA decay
MKVIESICDQCIKAEDEVFEKVREFVRENPKMTVKDVADACDVSVKRILQYIRDGRLEASSGMHGEVTCSQCGKPITVGRMCEQCMVKTGVNLNKMKDEYKLKGRMFTAGR